VVRVLLPAHLKTLAGVRGEVKIDVAGTVSAASILDALETTFPALRGTIRNPVTGQRRPFVRFFVGARISLTNPSTKNYPRASPRVMRPSSSSARWRRIADPGSLAAQRYFIETP